MKLSVDDYVQGFLNPTIPPIVGRPTFATLRELSRLLKQNAGGIPSNGGDGAKGLIRLVVSETSYATISAVDFVIPTNPGDVVNMDAYNSASNGSYTANDLTSANRAHDLATKIHVQWTTVGNALKQQTLGAVDDRYTRSLKDPHIGYAGVTVLEILTHLAIHYSGITTPMLKANHLRFTAPLSAHDEPEDLFLQLDEAIAYADAGCAPYTSAQILQNAVDLVLSTGLYNLEIREWRRRAPEDRTFPNFRRFWSNAYLAWSEEQDAAISSGSRLQGHDTANAVFDPSTYMGETAGAIANLATATASDRDAVSALTSTVATLTAQLAAMQGQLSAAVALNTEQVAPRRNYPPRSRRRGNQDTAAPANARARPAQAATNHGTQTPLVDIPQQPGNWDSANPRIHYCHTCGFRCRHPSHKCKAPAAGHVLEAVARDTQGGSEVNKRT